MIGETVAHYRITAKLGEGGMGAVYRATDTKLKREVALKVLPEALAGDPERMARFQREAEVLASLNHPNIAHIYGVEDRALVMELVDGESPQGPLPFEEAWKIAAQIGDALDYAHERGIVHRDLKPANVKVTADGVVKLLDFGLAKAFTGPAAVPANPDNSPTLTLGATQLGVILGTAGYMAPEQAKGKTVDKRADIWSFGVVLYELLTGERLFEGEDVSDTLAQVLTKEPDLTRAPAQVRKLLRRCLEKDPKRRLRDIGEARYHLEEAAPSAAPARPRSRLGLVAMAAAGALAVIAAVGLTGWWRATRPVEHQLIRLDVDLGSDALLAGRGNTGSNIIVSPDGTRLAYIASVSGGGTRLFTRRLDQPQGTELRGTDGASGPFFSPDGQWLGFTAGQRIYKISVDGGAVVPLADMASGMVGASWGTDGKIAIGHRNGGLQWASSSGGALAALTELAKGEITHLLPSILPGGRAVLFVTNRGDVDVVSLPDHSRKTLAPNGRSPRYLATSRKIGHLIYVDQGTLFAVPFDPERLETRGTPVPVLDDVAQAGGSGAGQFDVSTQGTLVYRRGSTGRPLRTVQWIEATGKTEPLISKPGFYTGLRLSPDGSRLALSDFSQEGGSGDILVYDWQRDNLTRLTSRGDYQTPVWSPDGHYLVFGSLRGLFWIRDDGAGGPHPLGKSGDALYPGSFDPLGKRLAYSQPSGVPGAVGWILPVSQDSIQLRAGTPERLPLAATQNDPRAVFSPDGQWLAYTSNGGGQPEVDVQPASGPGPRLQISNDGGQLPVWSRHSKELLYRSGGQIMAVAYAVTGGKFVAEKPRVWVRLPPAVEEAANLFDLTPDGKRAVVLALAEPPDTNKTDHEIVMLLNFFDYLRQRVPLPQ